MVIPPGTPQTGGLAAAFQHAQRGLSTASAQFADAAGRIAAPATAPPPPSEALIAAQSAPDLGTAIVDAKVAQRLYEANLVTLRTADAMTKDLLRAV